MRWTTRKFDLFPRESSVLLDLWDGLWICSVIVFVVLLRKDFWGLSSDDSRLCSWQSRGLACVSRSNCHRLNKTLSGTLTNPKANCRPDKDKRSFSFLSVSFCRAKISATSVILGQSGYMWAEVWWVSGVSVFPALLHEVTSATFILRLQRLFSCFIRELDPFLL